MSEVDHVSVDYMVSDPTIFGPLATIALLVFTVGLVAWFMRGILATTVNSPAMRENSWQEEHDRSVAKNAGTANASIPDSAKRASTVSAHDEEAGISREEMAPDEPTGHEAAVDGDDGNNDE